MPTLDAAYFHKQVERCRWLASQSDESLARTLRVMAQEYEAQARELEAPAPGRPTIA